MKAVLVSETTSELLDQLLHYLNSDDNRIIYKFCSGITLLPSRVVLKQLSERLPMNDSILAEILESCILHAEHFYMHVVTVIVDAGSAKADYHSNFNYVMQKSGQKLVSSLQKLKLRYQECKTIEEYATHFAVYKSHPIKNIKILPHLLQTLNFIILLGIRRYAYIIAALFLGMVMIYSITSSDEYNMYVYLVLFCIPVLHAIITTIIIKPSHAFAVDRRSITAHRYRVYLNRIIHSANRGA